MGRLRSLVRPPLQPRGCLGLDGGRYGTRPGWRWWARDNLISMSDILIILKIVTPCLLCHRPLSTKLFTFPWDSVRLSGHTFVDQHHAGSLRRLGMLCRWGIVPPILANRLAASLSTSAFRPALTTAELEVSDVMRLALSNNSSSRFTVVLMTSPMPTWPVWTASAHLMARRLMRVHHAPASQSSSAILATCRPMRTE